MSQVTVTVTTENGTSASFSGEPKEVMEMVEMWQKNQSKTSEVKSEEKKKEISLDDLSSISNELAQGASKIVMKALGSAKSKEIEAITALVLQQAANKVGNTILAKTSEWANSKAKKAEEDKKDS